MTTSKTDGREGSLNTKTAATTNDELFPDNPPFVVQYEGDFDADIDAIADDSGYFSGDGLETNSSDGLNHLKPSSPRHASVQATGSSPEYSSYVDAAASVKVNHGSIYDGQGTYGSYGTWPEDQEYGDSSQPKYSRFSDEITGPSPLEAWVKTHERHESIAYRLRQPAKKHKVTKGRR